MKQNTTEILLLAALLLLSAVLGFSMFTIGHDWGDDFAAYILQAQSIVQGNMAGEVARNTFTIQESSFRPGPQAYPWGYPLLISPLVALFGPKITPLKLVNLPFFLLAVLAFYLYIRPRMLRLSALSLAAALALSPALLLTFDHIQSDMVFLALSSLVLLLLKRYQQASPLYLGMIGILIAAAFNVRTNGILLLAAVFFSHGLTRAAFQNWKRNLIPYAAALAGILLSWLVFPGGQESYFAHYSELFSLERLMVNIVYYLTLPGLFFQHLAGGQVFFWLVAGLFVLGLWQRRREELPVLAYFFLTLFIFISWPERQGLRFVYPLLPFFLYFAWEGGEWLSGWLTAKLGQAWPGGLHQGLWMIIAAASLLASLQFAQPLFTYKDISGPYDPFSYEMYEFIREETPEDAVIIFFKPRAMRLFTDRDTFLTDQCADLPKGDYVVINEKGAVNQLNPGQIEACTGDFTLEPVFNNRRMTVYKIIR